MPPTNKTTNNTKTASSIAPSWQSLYRTHPIKRRRLAANIPAPNLYIPHLLPLARGHPNIPNEECCLFWLAVAMSALHPRCNRHT